MKNFYIFCMVYVTLIFSGCAVKQTDDDATKVAKHVVNAPIYAVMAVGAAGTAAGGAVGYGISKTIDTASGVELYGGEKFLYTIAEDKLDENNEIAKFYNDKNFSLYKDKNGQSYLYIKAKEILLQTDDIAHSKRWSVAQFDKRPFLIFKGIQLPDSITTEQILSTTIKDKFDNPIVWGDNTFIDIQERRTGWTLSLQKTIIVIVDGAETINMSDNKSPKSIPDQVQYYFPENSQNLSISKLMVDIH